MAGFDVGDKVVYSPHGAGIVVARESRDDDFGDYLSIRIAHSKMTLMVPASAASEKGVRPIMGKKDVKKILEAVGGEAEVLPDNPQHRARAAAEVARGGDASQLAGVLRDLTGRVKGGKKLSATEQRTFTTAQLTLASEIALATDIEIEAAVAKLDEALGVEA
ncbi:MAG: transcriptional regulator, CarD family [Thermoleophilia bacterium]|nr:transcriptional regulator, CarD family [Thermoleophilia bacterium]